VRLIFTVLVCFIYISGASGQKDTLKHKTDSLPDKFYLLQKVKRDGVTMPEVEIKEVTVVGRPRSARRNEYRK
jgi:hypothetical protein